MPLLSRIRKPHASLTWVLTTYMLQITKIKGFPGGSDGEESICNARDLGLIPGLGRSHGGGHGNPLQ